MPDLELAEIDDALRALGVDVDAPDFDEIDDCDHFDSAGYPEVAGSTHDDDGTTADHAAETYDTGPAAPSALSQEDLLREWGLDTALDLPAPTAPPGYSLDGRSVLRYLHDSVPVPGQIRVTLARKWRFGRTGDTVQVPAVWVSSRDELAWVARIAPGRSTTRVQRSFVAAHAVPAPVWDAMAGHCFAVTAPEFAPDQLLGAADVAALAGLAPSSVPTFLARGALPTPTFRIGAAPLWSAPVLGVWLANRRPPGRPRRSARR